MRNTSGAQKSTANFSKLSAKARGHRTDLAAKASPIKSGSASRPHRLSREALRCRRKFLQFYPGGYRDPDYVELERSYKWNAHKKWSTTLDRIAYRSLLRSKKYHEIAHAAVSIESRTNLLFSFEKMAIRDAVHRPAGARTFAAALYEYLYGAGPDDKRFENWCAAIEALPRRQTRVLTWPIVTVFPFIARPDRYIYLKPTVTREASKAYGFDFHYESRPNWSTHASLTRFAEQVRRDTRDLRPRDMIDLQSFIWVQGSDEYTSQ
jgi:hypothetical protein